jgi:hypothetical protein
MVLSYGGRRMQQYVSSACMQFIKETNERHGVLLDIAWL